LVFVSTGREKNLLEENKPMKSQFLSFALCSLVGLGAAVAAQVPQDQPTAQSGAQAGGQHDGHRSMDPNRRIQFLTKKLNLSADQQNQILPILTDQQQQTAAIRNDSSLSQQDRRDKFRALHQDGQSKIEAVLTADQKQTYEQMQQHRHQHQKDAPKS
jgi:protein CpxP